MVEAIRQGDIPGVQLRCRQALALTPEAAWAWLTEAEKLECWLADRAEVVAGEEGSLALASEDLEGEPLAEHGRTLELVPTRLWVLAFRRTDTDWRATTHLNLEILPRPEGCELSVLQRGFQNLPLSTCLTIWEFYRRRWRRALDRLARATVPPS